MSNFFIKTFSIILLSLGCFFNVSAQGSKTMMSLAGDSSTKFHSLFRISDGTYLVGGEANSLTWLPSGIAPVTLTLPGTTNSNSSKIAFILHLSPDLKTIVRALRFPANTVLNVFKIKTNAIPGQTTGDIFISGFRDGENTSNGFFAGYYLAKLNGNFLNGNIPSGLAFIYDVATRGIDTNNSLAIDLMKGIDQYKNIQPWDVQSDGRIVYGLGHAYSSQWAAVNRLRANGLSNDTVRYWPRQDVRIKSSIAAVTGRITEVGGNDGFQVGDSILYTNNRLNFSGKVAIDSITISTLVFKVNRSGSNLRSYTQLEFDLVSEDENGNPSRFGKYPEDFMYPSACITGNCPFEGSNPNTFYETNFGNRVNTTHRLGDIAIDRRNNDMYFGYSTLCKHPKSKLFSSDVEPIVLAMQSNGRTKWWNRLHKESPADGSPAAQEIDGLALDYANNHLIVAGTSHDTCLYNFWKGNEIALNQGKNGFQNQFTGTLSTIKTAWLGKMNLNNGKMRAATYVGEYANDIGQAGSIFTDKIMDGWPSPNDGNPNLANTKINSVEVGPNGDVLIRGEATRTITTANAYQRMPKPGQGLAPINQFVRVYSAGLDSVKYSSAISLIYEPNRATNSSTIKIQASTLSQEGIVVAGFSSSSTGKLGVINPPAFGDSLSSRKTAFIGILDPICDTVETPLSISGAPAAVCEGSSYTLSTPASGSNSFVWAYPNGWVGSDSAFSANTSTIVLKANKGAQGGLVSVVKKSACGLSLPFGLSILRPLPISLTIIGNAGMTAATYNQPTNAGVWFVNGDTAKRANGQVIRTSTIIFAQIVPALANLSIITARLINDCGTFNSNEILITSVKSNLLSEDLLQVYPNPTQSNILIQTPESLVIESVSLIDQMGKELKAHLKERTEQGQNINLSQLSSGIYILKVNTKDGIIRKRVVKN